MEAFPVVIVPEVVLLLAVHPRDDLQITFLFDSQLVFCILIVSLNLTYLLLYFAEQVKQPACNLSRLAPAMLALFPVCQVRFLHVKELCPRMVDSQSPAQLTGIGCCRSAVPIVSDSRIPCTSSGTSEPLPLQE